MTDPTPNAHGSRPASQPPGTPPDLVVGLGASAGGLEALQPFFVALPPDTGLAYVVVQHLDPATSTLLPDLLAKVTAMPVAEARDGAPVLRDHVYVAPAQAIVRLEGDVLRVTPAAGDELRTPVNDFFFSLADARQTAAVAVVLSGNGTDGAYGLKAVSDAGGMTMAQDPATARHDTMPRNAATLGPADRVLPPEKRADAPPRAPPPRPGPGRGRRGRDPAPSDRRIPRGHLRSAAQGNRSQLQALQDEHAGPPRRPANADSPDRVGRPVRRAA